MIPMDTKYEGNLLIKPPADKRLAGLGTLSLPPTHSLNPGLHVHRIFPARANGVSGKERV